MKDGILKVLLVIEQCNPDWPSVPLVGYRFYEGINQLADTTLVTHGRNEPALRKIHPNREITYIYESDFIRKYYEIAARMSKINQTTIWPLHNTLTYPVYDEFNHLVYSKFKDSVLKGDYDIVHVITPMMPRYPAKIIKACKHTPFIIGPVNGGVPFPKGFKEVAWQEFYYFNFLRLIGRFIIPGYRETYKQSNYILAGSTYTLDLIKNLFDIDDNHIELFFENGILSSFLKQDVNANPERNEVVRLLFVGRLVPYKGADMLVEAMSGLEQSVRKKINLTIVGDGAERKNLEQKVLHSNLKEKVYFSGWVSQEEILYYYRNSDIFCFPSIREFGGAVVLEAMASGLPCIVVDNGGIGEYVTEETGFKINPISRNYVIQELKKYIQFLVQDQELRHRMSLNAVNLMRHFTWEAKAEKVVSTYYQVMQDHG